MAYLPIEETEFYKRYEEVADLAWSRASEWDGRRWRAVGDQLVRSAASINANLAEGDARGTERDALRFFIIARASVREARVWLTRGENWCGLPREETRAQIDALTEATRSLNAVIKYRRNVNQSTVREVRNQYGSNEEPEAESDF